MDNVFELIVFLITAVIFIVSAITKQKKKPNQKVSGMDNLVESFFGITEEPEPYVDSTDDSPVIEHSRLKTNNENREVKNVKEEVNVMPDIEDERKDVEDSDQLADFDLRQAVIYSEILNRKHF